MKTKLLRANVIAIGLALLAAAIAPSFDRQPVAAASLLVITDTPEPPTLTPILTVTPSTPLPSSTPGPYPPPATATPPSGAATPTSTRVPSSGTADPAITKAVNVTEAHIGDEVIFTLTVTNHGTANAADVTVVDAVPDFLDVIEATTTKGNVSSEGRTVRVVIGTVAPGEVVTIRIRARVNERAQPPGGFNGASVTTTSKDSNPNNNTSGVPVPVVGPATPTATSPAAPTPSPPLPRKLPNTGAPDAWAGISWLLAALGLAAIATSLLLRRWRAR